MFVIVRATEHLMTGSSRNKMHYRVWESGRPNWKSRSSQKDGTSNHWDRSSRTTNQDYPIGNQDPRKRIEHRISGKDIMGRRIRTTQLEIKILAKRRNIESLGQIFRDNKSGRPNQKSRSSQKDETSHDWDRSSGATNQDDWRIVKYSIEWSSQREEAFEIRRTFIAMSKRTRKTHKHKSLFAQKPYLVRISRFERISHFTRKAWLNRTQLVALNAKPYLVRISRLERISCFTRKAVLIRTQ